MQENPIVYFTKEQKIAAKGFSGRRIKCDFNYSFKSVQSMEEHIKEWTQRLENIKKQDEEYAKQRREYVHNFKVGDILDTCWGYDQTNVEFFQVIEIISDKSIKICEVEKERCNRKEDNVKPCKNQFSDEPMIRKVSIHGTVAINKYRIASKMTHESSYCTPWHLGH